MKVNRRDLIMSAGALALAGGLEPAASVAALPDSSPTDMLKYVHPELRPAAQMAMQISAKMPPLNAATLAIATPQRSALGVTRGRPREYGITFQFNFGGNTARAQ